MAQSVFDDISVSYPVLVTLQSPTAAINFNSVRTVG